MAQLFGILGGLTVVFGLIAAVVYRLFDKIARDNGMIDAQSNF